MKLRDQDLGERMGICIEKHNEYRHERQHQHALGTFKQGNGFNAVAIEYFQISNPIGLVELMRS